MTPDQLQSLLDALAGDFRALSIWPEWIYAFCFLNKRIENRGPTVARDARRHIGEWIGLHGSKRIGGKPPNFYGNWNQNHANAVKEMTATARAAGEKPGQVPLRDIIDCRIS